MKLSFFSPKTRLLVISVLANLALLFACGWLFLQAKSSYTDYRYFRALGIGTSESTNLKYEASPAGETKVVLFGDSRVQNWIPAPEIDNTIFINAGINGETTTEMRRRFQHDVLRHQPDIVVMQAGVNDLTAAVTRGIEDPQELIDIMHSNMQYYIDALKDQNIQLVITSIFPNSTYSIPKRLFWHGSLSTDIVNSNRIIEGFANSSGANYLDLSSVFYRDSSTLNRDMFIDTLHINASAYSEINKALSELLPTLSQSQ